MAFKMNGSPLNQGLNLFRKGRGKEARKLIKATKKQLRKTGGAQITSGDEGYTVSGGTGIKAGEGQSGAIRRRTARKLASEVLAGGADSGSASIVQGKKKMVTKKQTVDIGGGEETTYGRDVRKEKGQGDWSTTKGSVTQGVYTPGEKGTTRSYKVDFGDDTEGAKAFAGTTGDERQNIITSRGGWTDDSDLNMKSSAFKMKYSPFNQGFGSPLNWNEGGASPLNNLKERAWNDDPLKMQDSPLNQSSPLNDKESCEKGGGTWENGACTTTTSSTEDVELENLAEGETGAGTATSETSKTEREAGKKGTPGLDECKKKHGDVPYGECCKGNKKIGTAAGCQCWTCVDKGDKALAETKKKNCKECEEDEKRQDADNDCGYICVKDTSSKKTKFAGDFKGPDKEGKCDEGFEKVTVDGETQCQKDTTETTSGSIRDDKSRTGKDKTTCKKGFKRNKDGDCVEKGKKKDKDCTPKECGKNRTWDTDSCSCVKVAKGDKEPKDCKGNKVWSPEKGRCVQKEKEESTDDKPCKCVKYSPRGCNEGDSSPLNQRGECPDNYKK